MHLHRGPRRTSDMQVLGEEDNRLLLLKHRVCSKTREYGDFVDSLDLTDRWELAHAWGLERIVTDCELLPTVETAWRPQRRSFIRTQSANGMK
jgi:hypothetical protein